MQKAGRNPSVFKIMQNKLWNWKIINEGMYFIIFQYIQ